MALKDQFRDVANQKPYVKFTKMRRLGMNEGHYKSYQNMLKVMYSGMLAFQKAGINLSKVINSIDFNNLYSNLNVIVKDFNKVPDRIRIIQDKLAGLGWYFIDDIALSDFLILKEGTKEEIDKVMSEYAISIIDEVVKGVQNNYEERYHIIQDAIEAHNKDLFSLSIPIFLIQADGICDEMLNVSLYSKYKGVPKTKEAKKSVFQEIDENSLEYILYMRPLDIITSMSMKYEEGAQKNYLNRHGIIHGIDTNYNSKINSMKCIVLLKYLLDINEKYNS